MLTALGRLLTKRAEKATSEPISPTNLPIEHIIPNQNQPRKDFSQDELSSLASSIRETGIIQPIS